MRKFIIGLVASLLLASPASADWVVLLDTDINAAFGGTSVHEAPYVGVEAGLPTPTEGRVAYVTDGATTTDCVTGGAGNLVQCMGTGSIWTAASGGGGGGADEMGSDADRGDVIISGGAGIIATLDWGNFTDLSAGGVVDNDSHTHVVANLSDTTATNLNLNELTDLSETTLHSHAGGGEINTISGQEAQIDLIHSSGKVGFDLRLVDLATADFSLLGDIISIDSTHADGTSHHVADGNDHDGATGFDQLEHVLVGALDHNSLLNTHGALHNEAHVLATTGPHTGLLPDSDMETMLAYTLSMNNSASTAARTDVKISALTEELTPLALDWVLGEDAAGNLRKYDVGNLPTGGGGQANTHSSEAGGLSIAAVIPKVGIDLRLKALDAGDFTLNADVIEVDTSIARTSALHAQSHALDSGTDHTGTLPDLDLENMAANTVMLREAGAGVRTDQRISLLSDEPTPAALDFVMIERADGTLARADVGDILGGGGGSNVSVDGGGTIANPDFTTGAGDVDFLDTAGSVTATVNATHSGSAHHVAATAGSAGVDIAAQVVSLDVAPTVGSATLEESEDALQVKYDATLTEGASGLGANLANNFTWTGDHVFQGQINLDTRDTLAASATPSIAASTLWITNAAAQTITDFTGDAQGDLIVVLENKAALQSTLDCTASSLDCGTDDILMAQGDMAIFVEGTGSSWTMVSYHRQNQNMGPHTGASTQVGFWNNNVLDGDAGLTFVGGVLNSAGGFTSGDLDPNNASTFKANATHTCAAGANQFQIYADTAEGADVAWFCDDAGTEKEIATFEALAATERFHVEGNAIADKLIVGRLETSATGDAFLLTDSADNNLFQVQSNGKTVIGANVFFTKSATPLVESGRISAANVVGAGAPGCVSGNCDADFRLSTMSNDNLVERIDIDGTASNIDFYGDGVAGTANYSFFSGLSSQGGMHMIVTGTNGTLVGSDEVSGDLTFHTTASVTKGTYFFTDIPCDGAGEVLDTDASGALICTVPAGSGDIATVGDCFDTDCFTAGSPNSVLTFNNATSGTVTLNTVTGALGAVTVSLPATTGTVALVGHTIASHDTTTTGAQLDELVDATNADLLHIHSTAGISGLTNADITLAATDLTDTALLARVNNETFTGTHAIPSPFSVGGTSVTATATELNLLAGTAVTSTEFEELATLEATSISANDWTQLALLDGGSPALSVASMTGSLDLGAGTISGAVVVNAVTATTDSPVAGEMDGHWHICSNAAGCDITLPTAVAGMSGCWYDTNGGGTIQLDAFAGDEILLDGAGIGVADSLDSPGGLGDFMCILAIDATNWLALGRSGVWVDGGP